MEKVNKKKKFWIDWDYPVVKGLSVAEAFGTLGRTVAFATPWFCVTLTFMPRRDWRTTKDETPMDWASIEDKMLRHVYGANEKQSWELPDDFDETAFLRGFPDESIGETSFGPPQTCVLEPIQIMGTVTGRVLSGAPDLTNMEVLLPDNVVYDSVQLPVATFGKAVTNQFYKDKENGFAEVKARWSYLLSRGYKLTATHYMLYAVLQGKDYRKGFKPAKGRQAPYQAACRAVTQCRYTREPYIIFAGLLVDDVKDRVGALLPYTPHGDTLGAYYEGTDPKPKVPKAPAPWCAMSLEERMTLFAQQSTGINVPIMLAGDIKDSHEDTQSQTDPVETKTD